MKVFNATHKLLDSLASKKELEEEIFLNFLAERDKAQFLFTPIIA